MLSPLTYSYWLPVNYKSFIGQYPFGLEYDTIGYYSVDPADGLVVLTVHPEVYTPFNYGAVVLVNMYSGVKDSASYLDFEPVQAYFYGKYIVVTGLHHVSSSSMSAYRDGLGVYIVDRDLMVVYKKIINYRYITSYFPYTRLTVINDKSFILPAPSIVINGSGYAKLFIAAIFNNGLYLDEIFSLKTRYYPYLAPIVHGDYIFWGGLIISRDNYELIKEYVFNANSSYAGFINGGVYYYANYYSYPTYRALEVIGVDTSSLDIVYRRTVFNVSSTNPIDIFRMYVFDNRYIVYIASLTPSHLGFLLSNKIGVGVYDVKTNKSYIPYNATVNGFLVGSYEDKVLLFINTRKLIIIDPALRLVANQTISNIGLNYRSPGDLVLLHDPSTKQYYLLLLPIMYDKYYLVIIGENELKPLPEPNTSLILAATIIVLLYPASRRNKRFTP